MVKLVTLNEALLGDNPNYQKEKKEYIIYIYNFIISMNMFSV